MEQILSTDLFVKGLLTLTLLGALWIQFSTVDSGQARVLALPGCWQRHHLWKT